MVWIEMQFWQNLFFIQILSRILKVVRVNYFVVVGMNPQPLGKEIWDGSKGNL